MKRNSPLNWLVGLILSESERDAVHRKLPQFIKALQLDVRAKTQDHEEQLLQLILRVAIRKAVKIYIYVVALGISTRRILMLMRTTPKGRKILIPERKNFRSLALFSSLIISLRPVFERLFGIQGSDSKRGKFAATIMTSALASLVYPGSFLLETVSLWYLFFGIEFGFRLFDHRQINSNTDLTKQKEEVSKVAQKFHKFTRGKSWLLFCISSSMFWRNFILNPTKAHGLPSQIYSVVLGNVKLNGKDFASALRSQVRLGGLLRSLNWSNLLRQLLGSYIRALGVSTFMITIKKVLQNEKVREDLKTKSAGVVLMNSIREALKLSVLIGGVPIVSLATSILVLQCSQLTSDSLSTMGFASGTLAAIYRGRNRKLEENSILLEVTNRGAWLVMLRETLIAALSGNRHAEAISRIALASGFTALLTLDCLESQKEEAIVFHDAKLLRYLVNLSR